MNALLRLVLLAVLVVPCLGCGEEKKDPPPDTDLPSTDRFDKSAVPGAAKKAPQAE